MLNLVIAVLCEALSALKDENEEDKTIDMKNDEVTVVTTSINSEDNKSGMSSSIETLEQMLQDKNDTISNLCLQMNEIKCALKGIAELQLFLARKVSER